MNAGEDYSVVEYKPLIASKTAWGATALGATALMPEQFIDWALPLLMQLGLEPFAPILLKVLQIGFLVFTLFGRATSETFIKGLVRSKN